MAEARDPGGGGAERRAEVDTSAPFESVRAAVDRFGGSAIWKLQLKQLFVPEKHHPFEELEEHMTVGEQTTKLEMDLMVKEKETFEVLKELEITKRIVDELKMKLQKDTSEAVNTLGTCSDNLMLHLDTKEQPRNPNDNVESVGLSILVKQSPGLILMELKQAKLNLNRTTNDLASIRATIELLNSRIKEERALLEKTHERLSLNTMKASALEEEINRKTVELLKTSSSNIPSQIKQLNSQKEHFMKITKTAEAEISKLTAEIKETKSNIKAAEIRCLVAKKMEEAAKVAEAIALTKTAALMNSEDSEDPICEDSSKVVLSVEEYDILTRKAQEADELSKKKIEAAMLLVDEANRSKQDLLLKVEEAIADVETSKKALEAALNREEAANQEKLVVEAGLRKWRSEHGQKRRSTNNSTKFKNSCTTHQRRDSRMLDVNGLSLNASGSRSPLRPTLSIGQILSRKLTGPEDYESTPEIVTGKPKVSLGQILSGRHGSLSPQSTDDGINRKQSSAKRKKLGFTGFSLQLTAKNKKSKKRKKRQTRNPVNCRPKLVSLLV